MCSSIFHAQKFKFFVVCPHHLLLCLRTAYTQECLPSANAVVLLGQRSYSVRQQHSTAFAEVCTYHGGMYEFGNPTPQFILRVSVGSDTKSMVATAAAAAADLTPLLVYVADIEAAFTEPFKHTQQQ